METHEARALHRRDMNKDVLAAALGLDEDVTLGRIEPFHGTCRHPSLLRSCIVASEHIGRWPAAALIIWYRCAFGTTGSMINRARQSTDDASVTAIPEFVDSGGHAVRALPAF